MRESPIAAVLPASVPTAEPTAEVRPSVLFVEGCDFETFPAGGQLAMARSLVRIFGPRLALVGMSSGDAPVGRWIRRTIDGAAYWFFSVCRKQVSARRPLLPARLTFYLGLQRYRRRILALGCRDALVQAPEGLLAVAGWRLASLCFMFPGVENPLAISRYGFARRIAPAFDRLVFRALGRADAIVACADEAAIARMTARSGGLLPRRRVTQLPTCVDTARFRPASRREARAALGIPQDALVLANCGRIGRFKGWQLLVDAFDAVRRAHTGARLYFIGDGEDRPPLEAYVAARGLQSAVTITGFQDPASVARHWNAADVAVFGSLVEGWSVAMLEALACGKPIVTTDVSGARQMVDPGANGFILTGRDPDEFARAVEAALRLPGASAVSTSIAERYSLPWMGNRMRELWEPLR